MAAQSGSTVFAVRQQAQSRSASGKTIVSEVVRTVLEDPLGVLHGSHDVGGVPLVRVHKRLLDVVVDRRFCRGHEARAHVHTVAACPSQLEPPMN